MKNVLLLVCIYLCSLQLLNGQTVEKMAIGPDETVEEAMIKQIYRYPDFQFGKVYFKDGSSSNARLNLNFWLNEMQFIDQKKDTLTIADPTVVKFIEIGKDHYLYNDGYMEVINVFKEIKLAKKRKIRFSDEEKEGAYGQKNPTSSITGSSSYNATNGLLYDLKVKENIIVTKEEVFYLIDEKGRIRLANKNNVLKAFPERKSQIDAYVKENKVDFRNEEQLAALLEFSSAG